MTITYPLSIPAEPGFNSVTLKRSAVGDFTASPYTGAQYVQVFAGQWWQAELGLPKMKASNAAAWRSFFAKLNGVYGTFLLGPDPEFATPRGSAATVPGTPVVNGADQSGNTLSIAGLPADATGYLLAGDFIQLGSGASTRLHMMMDDADSNGSGEADLLIWPNLRESPADGAAIVVSNAKGRFRLTTPVTEDSITPGPFWQMMTLSAIEAL